MSQSLAQIFIHVVFSTKHREPIIIPSIQRELHRYMTGILKNQDWTPIEIGGIADHIHLLFIMPRTIPIAKVVEILKTSSSKWLKTKGPELKNFHWQSGYGAFSVSNSQVTKVASYIANQEDHHRKFTFQDEFIDLLQRYGIPYDDRYIWD